MSYTVEQISERINLYENKIELINAKKLKGNISVHENLLKFWQNQLKKLSLCNPKKPKS